MFTSILLLLFLFHSASADAESLQDLFPETDYDMSSSVTIFIAGELETMAGGHSDDNAIAVRDGLIVDIDSAESLLQRFKNNPGLVVNRQFAEKTITPGLIDPHLHLWLFAMLSNAKFNTPADWSLPWDDVKGVVGHDAYLQRLTEHETSLTDPDELHYDDACSIKKYPAASTSSAKPGSAPQSKRLVKL